MTTSHPFFPFEHLQFYGTVSWSTGSFQSNVRVLSCQTATTATISEEERTESFWNWEMKAVERISLKTIHDKHKHEKQSQVFWCLITRLQNGHYHMWLGLFSQLCWFHQNFWQCWRKRLPETHIVWIIFKISAIISTLYPTTWNRKHWISVWNERQDLETSNGWRNSLALECFKSFILLLKNGGSLQVLVYKKPNKPSVYKAGSIFIFTLLNQEEATVMKKKIAEPY